jgi:peptidoglycan/xylan/chitin deacetylase (PgdA/CDA1 family)
MKGLSLRTIVASLLRVKLFLFKKNPELCIVTLHNIQTNQFKWFEGLIDFIDKKYGFIDPGDFFTKKKYTGSGVLLTFDDGFNSNRIVTENILRKYNVKAIFFITEKFINLNKTDSFAFSQDYFYPNSKINQEEIEEFMAMTWGDIDWLVSNGHTIGAHTATHRMLSKIDDLNVLQDEIKSSADRLENKIKSKVRIFAFPFGTPDSISIKAFELSKNRFDYVFSNVRGCANKSPSNYFLFRQNIIPGDPLWIIRLIIEGQFDWKYKKIRSLSLEKFINKKD